MDVRQSRVDGVTDLCGQRLGRAAASYLPNSQYTSDGVHPNAAGAQLMADAWYAALAAKNIP